MMVRAVILSPLISKLGITTTAFFLPSGQRSPISLYISSTTPQDWKRVKGQYWPVVEATPLAEPDNPTPGGRSSRK